MQIISSTFFNLMDVPERLDWTKKLCTFFPSFRKYYWNWGLMHDLEERGVDMFADQKKSKHLRCLTNLSSFRWLNIWASSTFRWKTMEGVLYLEWIVIQNLKIIFFSKVNRTNLFKELVIHKSRSSLNVEWSLFAKCIQACNCVSFWEHP